jgi:hypothetical protein
VPYLVIDGNETALESSAARPVYLSPAKNAVGRLSFRAPRLFRLGFRKSRPHSILSFFGTYLLTLLGLV